MTRTFRSTNTINQFIQELESECSSKHEEFDYLIPPHAIRQGYEIRGKVPLWLEAPKHRHMKCAKQKCENCFLLCIKDPLDIVVKESNLGCVPDGDILRILSVSASTKNSMCTFEKKFVIKSNFEFDGCEANVVIVIQNGGLLRFSLSNAISRAVSRLVHILPDDENFRIIDMISFAKKNNLCLICQI